MIKRVSYIILIHIPDHVLKFHILDAKFLASRLNLILGDETTSVLVEELESCIQMIFSLYLVHVQSCGYKLQVIYSPAVVSVCLYFKINAGQLNIKDIFHARRMLTACMRA